MPPKQNPQQQESVSDVIIRQIFNEDKFYQRMLNGELTTVLKRNNHKAPPSEPYCTHSQIVYYYDHGIPIAVVHQYMRPDGKLGASGLPDPKYLIKGNTTYRVKK